MNVPLSIRDATAADLGAWRPLWEDYLAFYGVTLAPGVTEATWARILDPASPLACRLALAGGALAGFAVHSQHASSWVAGDDAYLEDLFVAPAFRGQGIGRALIDDLVQHARGRGLHRLYWHADLGNDRARALYDSITPDDGHVRYRLKL